MAEKIFKTRIKQRRDTSANWESKNPVLLNGEVVIVDTANGETRTKTGNGTKTYTQLPFDDEGAKGGKGLIDKSFADNVSTSGNTTTIDQQLKTYSVTTRLEADVAITGLDENGQEVTKHKLSEKANSSDVLTKTNTTEFTPTADYQPATKKYVDANKLSHIANGETIGTIKIGRTGSQRADGPYSTIIGFGGHTGTDALGSVAIGNGECLANYTVAIGTTVASGDNQLVFGRYNVKDTENKYACIIGNGTSDTARSNAHTVDWDGNAWFVGDVEGTKDGATHKLSEKANVADVALLQYYGTTDITISDSSYFTVNSTGETITGLTNTGKTQTELVIPYEINGKKITTLFSGSDGYPVSILNGNSTITKVVIPKSVTTLGRSAFFSCRSLTSIDIPNSVTSIGDYAFVACSGLTSINLPNGVTSIGKEAFSSCSGLKSINLPNDVTSIGERAFSGCTSLTSINIPNSVTSIEVLAFNGCSSVTIYCEQGSYAETFAKTNNIPIVYTDIKEDVIHKKAEAKTYTVSVPTTSWTEKTDTDNQKYYYKKITVSGMTASGQAMTDVVMHDSVAIARRQMEAYQCVNRVVTGDDCVELYCFDEVPTTAFTLRILVISNILS